MCPWENWKPTGVYFCEEMLCGWIRQPANSFSNLFFVFAAIYLWNRSRRLSWIALVIAAGSFFLHASMTFAGEVADLGGMFLLAAQFLSWTLERFLRRPISRSFFWLAGLSPMALMLAFGSIGILIFQIEVASLVLMEFALWRRGDTARYAYARTGLFIFTLAYGLWWLDVLQGWCNPQNHWFSGHVLWHALTALALVPFSKFYSTCTSAR